MKLAFLSPNQSHRYNRGHQQFRDEFRSHFKTLYVGNGYNKSSHSALKIEHEFKPDVVATYGLKYTKPYQEIDKVKALKVHFVCDYLTSTPHFWGYEKEYDALLKRDNYDILFCRTLRVAEHLKNKSFIKGHIYFLPFSIDPQTYYVNGHDRSIDISTCWSRNERVYPHRNDIEAFVLKNFSDHQITIGNRYKDDFVRTLQQSKININSLSAWKGINMKVFEAMACGSLCITDRSPEMDALGLVNGRHLVNYNSIGELKAKIDYYLMHEKERNQIAMMGRQKIKNHHTHRKMVENVKCLLEGVI